MGIFGRMKTLLKANVNDLASKAENPELVLNQVIADMEDQLSKAKIEVRDTIATRKRLEKQRDQAQAKAKDWERKAMKAVEAGRDDLAREALARKQKHEEEAAGFHTSWEAQSAAVDKLRNALRQLASKIEEAKRKKNVLLAKKKRIDAQGAMATTAQAATDTSTFDTFEKHAAKIEDFESGVEAHAELEDTFREAELESKFSRLEEDHSGDDALAALKKKMGHSDAD
jgi:phage shock protein A